MEITFELIDGLYTTEFEVNSNCNIHVEREGKGQFFILQRGTKTGKYAVVLEEDYNKTTIDVDMLDNIYPKYIKVTSTSMPTYAEVNFAEEGGDSGDGGIVYFDLRGVDKEFAMTFVGSGSVCKILTNNNFIAAPNTIVYGPSALFYEMLSGEVVDYVLGCGVRWNELCYAGPTITPTPITFESLLASGFSEEELEIYNNIPRITREEYDNLQPNK